MRGIAGRLSILLLYSPCLDISTVYLTGLLTLVRPFPPTGNSVIRLCHETQVVLTINLEQLPIQPPVYNGIKIPPTGSVKNYADMTGKNWLEFRICLYSATMKQYYNTVCTRCERQEGRKRGVPGFIEPKGGEVHVEFMF